MWDFEFDLRRFLDSSKEQAYNRRFVDAAIVGTVGPDHG
jgi:hypothetical protein